MFSVLDIGELEASARLRRSMLDARTQQFVDRHGWELRTNHEGLEVDQFDVHGTIYCVSHEGDQHAASVRLRHADDGSMVEEVFRPFWERHGARLAASHEVTRFCCTPGLEVQAQASGVSELLLGLHEFCRTVDIEEFFGVIFPSVARNLALRGWPPAVIDEMGVGRGRLLLCVWQPTSAVLVALREKAGRRKIDLRAPTGEE